MADFFQKNRLQLRRRSLGHQAITDVNCIVYTGIGRAGSAELGRLDHAHLHQLTQLLATQLRLDRMDRCLVATITKDRGKQAQEIILGGEARQVGGDG